MEVQYPVVFFSFPHITILLVLWSTAVFLAFFLSRKYKFSNKVIWVCMLLSLLCEIDKIFFFMTDTGNGFRLPAEFLPFNLCSIQIFFISALALSHKPKKNKILISFMYPSLIGGGILGSVIPSFVFNYHGFLDFATYRFFIYHAMLIFLGLYLYKSKPIKFTIKNFGYASVFIWMIFIFAIWINGFFGWEPETNFCLLVRPPAEGLPFINMDSGWSAYVSRFALIAFSIIFLCYLPVFIKEIKQRAGNKHVNIFYLTAAGKNEN